MPENRLVQGIIQNRSVVENITVTVLDKILGAFGLIDLHRQRKDTERLVDALKVKTSSLDAPLKTLSGGNQQKVVLGKWLITEPRVLILDEPTVGIDVLAKNGVHDLIKDLAKQGMGIIFISDEIQEVLANCHRVLVMHRGRILHELVPGPESERELLEKFNLS